MSSLKISILILASLVIVSYSGTISSSERIIPFELPLVNTGDNSVIRTSNIQNRLINVIEHIIRYVSSIKSTDTFIENIVNRHNEPAEKIEVLAFLNKCFELTRKVIQREVDYMLATSTAQKKSYSQSTFTLEELRQAQRKVNELLASIEKQVEPLKTWIPPTMPFLGFF